MGFGNLPRVETGPGSSIVDEDKRILEIPAWEKLLACGRGGRGISMWLDHTPPAPCQQSGSLNKWMVQQNA
jgi:hypothetical protein